MAKRRPTPNPPAKLSALIRLAVADARKVQKMPTRRLDMGLWHVPRGSRGCTLCMAGAVMDRTLRAPVDKFRRPDDFSPEWERALNAINAARCGAILGAYDCLTNTLLDRDQRRALKQVDSEVTGRYDPGIGRAPWATYDRAAAMLARAGL